MKSELKVIVVTASVEHNWSDIENIVIRSARVACDFAVAATLIQGCIDQFKMIRDGADQHCNKY